MAMDTATTTAAAAAASSGAAKESHCHPSFNDLYDPILLHIAKFLCAEDLCHRWELLNRRTYRLVSSTNNNNTSSSTSHNAIWYNLCCKSWSSYPRYRNVTEPERRHYFENRHPELSSFLTWKQRYRWMVQEMKRSHLRREELEGIMFDLVVDDDDDEGDDNDTDPSISVIWWFNYTPEAGGRGDETLCRVRFINGFIFVPQYLPMPYRLLVDNTMDGEADEHDDSDEDHEDGHQQQQQQRQQYLAILDFPRHKIERIHETGEWLITNDAVTFVSCCSEHIDDKPTYKHRGFRSNDNF